MFPIPDEIESHDAASMFCAGLTVYSPLKTYGCGPGKKVGIMGIGGLGHYAILWAKAMGAEVYALTHDDSKIKDIKKMGADHIINTEKKVGSVIRAAYMRCKHVIQRCGSRIFGKTINALWTFSFPRGTFTAKSFRWATGCRCSTCMASS